MFILFIQQQQQHPSSLQHGSRTSLGLVNPNMQVFSWAEITSLAWGRTVRRRRSVCGGMIDTTFAVSVWAELFQIDEGFAEDDLEANLQRDKHARLCNSVNQLIDELTPAAPDFQLQEACNQMVPAYTLFSCDTAYDHIHPAYNSHRYSRDALATRLFPWNARDTGGIGGKLFQRGQHEAASYRKSGVSLLGSSSGSILTFPSLSPKMLGS